MFVIDENTVGQFCRDVIRAFMQIRLNYKTALRLDCC